MLLKRRESPHTRGSAEIVLQPGGQILFAQLAETLVGCCALIRLAPDSFEVAKMAVDESFQGRVPGDGIDSLFFPPTVWVGLANHPGLASADLGSPRKAYYGASIMPVPILQRLQERLPTVGFFNCFGQSEIGPLASVLRPRSMARPDSVGRSVLFVQTRVVDSEMRDVAPGQEGEVIYRSPQLCSGYWGSPRRPPRHSQVAGFTPAIWAASTPRAICRRRSHQGRRQHRRGARRF